MASAARKSIPEKIKRFVTGLLPGQTSKYAEMTPTEFLRSAKRLWDDGIAKCRPQAYTVVPHFFYAEIPRLARGNSQQALLWFAWHETVGHVRSFKQAIPVASKAIEIHALAEVCRCTEQQLGEDLRDGLNRGLFTFRKVGGDKVSITLLPDGDVQLGKRAWADLPDYPRRDYAARDERKKLVEEKPEEPAAAGATRLWPKPVPMGVGAISPPIPIPPGTNVIRLKHGGDAGEFVVDPALRDGEMEIAVAPVKATLKTKALTSENESGLSKSGQRAAGGGDPPETAPVEDHRPPNKVGPRRAPPKIDDPKTQREADRIARVAAMARRWGQLREATTKK